MLDSALIALGLVAVVTLPLPFSYTAGLHRVRDWWLRGVAMGVILLVPAFLAPIMAWWAWQWPELAQEAGASERAYLAFLAPLISWAGVALSWALIARLEPSWWPWVAYGWVAWGVVQIGAMVYRAGRQGWRGFTQRQLGLNFGTPVMTALYLGLVAPFVPRWLWPVWALGLWISCSWAVFLALACGAVLYWWPF